MYKWCYKASLPSLIVLDLEKFPFQVLQYSLAKLELSKERLQISMCLRRKISMMIFSLSWFLSPLLSLLCLKAIWNGRSLKTEPIRNPQLFEIQWIWHFCSSQRNGFVTINFLHFFNGNFTKWSNQEFDNPSFYELYSIFEEIRPRNEKATVVKK